VSDPHPDRNSRSTASRVLAILLMLTVVISATRIGLALRDGAITDKHGQTWSRTAEPEHFWLLLIPCLVSVVIPAGVVIALWRRTDDRSR